MSEQKDSFAIRGYAKPDGDGPGWLACVDVRVSAGDDPKAADQMAEALANGLGTFIKDLAIKLGYGLKMSSQ